MSDEQDLQTEETTELDELKAELEKVTDAWKRSAADFENFRKRTTAERAEILQHVKEMTVLKLLPSLQSLEQVLKFAPSDDKYKDWIVGLKATIMQLEKTMEELGVTKVETIGQKFDPTKHEAVAEGEGESGKIIKEIQPGFALNGTVIIPAKVEVGK